MSGARDYDDIPGTFVFDGRRSREGYCAQHVLHVAQRRAQPRPVPGRRARVPRPLSVDARATRGGARTAVAAAPRARRQHLLHVQAGGLRRHDVPAVGEQADRCHRRGVRGDDGVGRPLDRGQSQLTSNKPRSRTMAEIVGGVGTSHIPAVGAAVDKGKHGRPVLDAVLRQAAAGAGEWIADGRPGRVHRRLQRPRQRVLVGADPDVRARPGRSLRDRRRGLRAASGPGGRRPSRAGVASRRVADPRRVRHDARATR